MPAILALPFVFLFGVSIPQDYISYAIGAGIVILTICISYKIKKDKTLAVWSGLLVGLGTIIWFMSSVGSVWYLGQTTAAFFVSAALLEALGKKRPLAVGALIGAAYLSRIPTLFCLLFLGYLLLKKEKNKIKKIFLLGAGLAPFMVFDFLYNFVRFGTIFNEGYFLLPKFLNETTAPWFVHGVMSPLYIVDNLKAAFWSFPKFSSHFPFITPSWYALSIWITTPAFFFSLNTDLKEWETRLAWLTIITIFFFDCLHGGTGWAQFGYRFAVDFYPILIFLTIKGVSTRNLNHLHWAVLFICILVNLWGVVFINKLGWVNF